MDNFFSDFLPYAGAGIGSLLPILALRVKVLEDKINEQEKICVGLKKQLNLYYFYLSKRDTNFSTFLSKYKDTYE